MTTSKLRWTLVAAGTAASISCGGRSSNGDDHTATTAAGAGGNGAVAAAGSANSSTGMGGSINQGVGGGLAGGGAAGPTGGSTMVDAGTCDSAASRCGFRVRSDEMQPGCAPSNSIPSSTATGATVLSRIAQFLENASSVVPSSEVPSEANATWAAAEATAILDRHVADNEAPSGLSRFLSLWLNAPSSLNLSDPHGWPLKLSGRDASLQGLLTDVIGDPRRIGILTDQDLLAARTEITERAAWFLGSVLCSGVPLPPQDHPVSTQPMPGLTRRESLLAQVSRASSCPSCHSFADPLGFSFEHFDEKGNYRDLDNGKPVDSSGNFNGTFKFSSIDDLAPQLADSCDVAQCFAAAMFKAALGADGSANAATTYGPQELADVANRFADTGFSVRELVKAIVGSPTFLR
jgi:hypothetical protein